MNEFCPDCKNTKVKDEIKLKFKKEGGCNLCTTSPYALYSQMKYLRCCNKWVCISCFSSDLFKQDPDLKEICCKGIHLAGDEEKKINIINLQNKRMINI